MNKETRQHFERLVAASQHFWSRSGIRPSDEGAKILCDMFHHDWRVAFRSLFIAKAVQAEVGGEVIAVGNAGPLWDKIVLHDYDVNDHRNLSHSFDCRFVDFQENNSINLRRLTREQNEMLDGFAEGRYAVNELRNLCFSDGFPIGKYVMQTYMRLRRTPTFERHQSSTQSFRDICLHCFYVYNSYRTLFKDNHIKYFITSHLDYSIWGIATELCIRQGIAILHFHTTQDIKIFSYFPEWIDPTKPLRFSFMKKSGDQFQTEFLPRADCWQDGIDRVLFHNKLDLSRPSWWLNGSVFLYDQTDRASMRKIGLSQLGWRNDKPVYCLFLHSFTDALWNNFELFDGYLEWIEETLAFAVEHPEINWLVRDHPAQGTYDGTGTFDKLELKYRRDHIIFSRAKEINKNILWSICDLGITVRGSIATEMPAYGIPVIQAGHSEMSGCGFSVVAKSREEYFTRLEEGAHQLSETEIRHARFWMFYYRTLTSVKSHFLPGFSFGRDATFFYYVKLNMSAYNVDDDPIFNEIANMLRSRGPVMLRTDLLDGVSARGRTSPSSSKVGEPLRTSLDERRQIREVGSHLNLKDLDSVFFHSGFSEGYDWGRWTIADSASILLRRPRPFDSALLVKFKGRANVFTSQRVSGVMKGKAATSPRPLEVLEVDVFANGELIGTRRFDGNTGGAVSREHYFYVPRRLVSGQRDLGLTFRIPIGNRTPIATGTGSDSRPLGLAMAYLSYEEVGDREVKFAADLWGNANELSQIDGVVGFDEPTSWGRWTVGPLASWRIAYSDEPAQEDMELTILMRAWLGGKQLPHELNARFFANGVPIGVMLFSSAQGGDVPRLYSFLISKQVMALRSVLQVDIEMDTQKRSPRSLGLDVKDERELGLAISRYALRPHHPQAAGTAFETIDTEPRKVSTPSARRRSSVRQISTTQGLVEPRDDDESSNFESATERER